MGAKPPEKGGGGKGGKGAKPSTKASNPAKSHRKERDILTGAQRKLIRGKAEGKTTRQAAKEAGLNEDYASTLLGKPKIKETLQSLMAKHGLDDASLLQKHAELLDANRTVSAVSGKDANAGTVDFVDVPDWQARAKGLDMAYKLKGAYTEKVEMGGKVTLRVVYDEGNPDGGDAAG